MSLTCFNRHGGQTRAVATLCSLDSAGLARSNTAGSGFYRITRSLPVRLHDDEVPVCGGSAGHLRRNSHEFRYALVADQKDVHHISPGALERSAFGDGSRLLQAFKPEGLHTRMSLTLHIVYQCTCMCSRDFLSHLEKMLACPLSVFDCGFVRGDGQLG